MDKELELLVTGGLLHDIGKLAQRAGRMQTSREKGEYGDYAHPYYTDYFIEHDLRLPVELEGSQLRSRLARLAAAHHKPDLSDLAELAIQRADHLSAGGDRRSGEQGEGDYKTARLISIFEQVGLKREFDWEELAGGKVHRLLALDGDEAAGEASFPVAREAAGQLGDYESLFQAFLEGINQLPRELGVAQYLKGLISLMERYCWCVPSATYKTLPDISLFDHSLTTAAIAQALWSYHHEHGGFPKDKAASEKKFLLLVGDLSGIQDFIFRVDRTHGAGVSKLFRARSFYLQALTRSVRLELLHRLGLYDVACIMDAGGRFILLLPATGRVKETLDAFMTEAQHWFFTVFCGRLSLVLHYDDSVREEDLEQERFAQVLDRLTEGLEEKKLHRFDRLLAELNSPVLSLEYPLFKEGGACGFCGVMPAQPEAMDRFEKDFGDRLAICSTCQQLIQQVGARLPRARYATFWKGVGDGLELFGGLRVRLHGDLNWLGSNEHGLMEVATVRQREVYAHFPLAGHLPMISPEDLEAWRREGRLELWKEDRRLREERLEADQPKTFNLLASLAVEMEPSLEGEDGLRRQGKALLGVFKADVDNLGLIFSLGLQERLSVSRYAFLSRMLNHFFSEHMVGLVKRHFPDTYIVFAGGDDIMVLGPWTQVVEFAGRLREEFARFTAGNPEIGLSAGIAVLKPGLPMQVLAREAEDLLERSKLRQDDQGRRIKDGVTLFDTTVGWSRFRDLLRKGSWLREQVRRRKISMGLCGRLLQYGDDYRDFLEEGKVEKGLCLSHMKYDFIRNVDKDLEKKDPELWREIMAVQQDEELLKQIRLPVTYALYRLRQD